MSIELILALLLAIAGLVFSAFFSGVETGLYTINRVRLAVRASHDDAQAIRLRDLLRRPNRVLSTLLIGNNMANYAGSFGIAAILDHLGLSPVQAILVNVAVLVPLLFIFGETLPKDLFRTFTDHWSYAVSGFLLWCQRLLTIVGLVPVVQGFGVLAGRLLGADSTAVLTARQRISQLIKEGAGVGILSETQVTLADRALALRHQTVGSEMIPWARVVTLPRNPSGARRESLLRTCRFTRVPVVNRDGRVAGILSLLDLVLAPDAPLDSMLQAALLLTPEQPISEALQQMRRAGARQAIVVRPGTRQPIGIVTLKDLVEPLIGELIER